MSNLTFHDLAVWGAEGTVQVGGISKLECVNGLEPGFLPAFLKPLFFSSVFGAVNSRQDVRSIE